MMILSHILSEENIATHIALCPVKQVNRGWNDIWDFVVFTMKPTDWQLQFDCRQKISIDWSAGGKWEALCGPESHE